MDGWMEAVMQKERKMMDGSESRKLSGGGVEEAGWLAGWGAGS